MLMTTKLDLKCDNAEYPGGSHQTPKTVVSLMFGGDCVLLESRNTAQLDLDDCKAIRAYMDIAINSIECVTKEKKL